MYEPKCMEFMEILAPNIFWYQFFTFLYLFKYFGLTICAEGLYMKQIDMPQKKATKRVQWVVHSGRHSQYHNLRHILQFGCT
jgi:hypothetical protein